MEWIIARWLTFATLAMVTGAALVGALLVPRLQRRGVDDGTLARDAARLSLGAAIALVPASALRLLDQLLALQSPEDPWYAGLDTLLGATTWGRGFVAQAVLHGCTLACAAFLARRPTARGAWWLLVALALLLCATPSLQGHAIGAEGKEWWAVASDVLHVAGASSWLGLLAAIGWTTLAVRGDAVTIDDADFAAERARRDARLRALVPLVPPIALTGAALLAVAGVSSSLVHLRTLPDLWTSEWGRYLTAKLVLAAGVVALGARNWRRLVPRSVAGEATARLRRSLALELALAALVLLVTAILVVTPPPGE